MTRILLILLLSAFAASAAQQNINIGAAANDGTGDSLRAAMIKIQTNFTELYTLVGESTGGSATNAVALNNGVATNLTIYQGLLLPHVLASRVLVTDANSRATNSVTTAAELAFVSGVTSAIQGQLDLKLATTTLTTVTNVLAGYAREVSSNGVRIAAGANITVVTQAIANNTVYEIAGPSGGSGEVNTMSVTGAGVGIKNAKVASDMPTKSFTDSSALLSWTSNATEIDLAFDWVTATQQLATIYYVGVLTNVLRDFTLTNANDVFSNSVAYAKAATNLVGTTNWILGLGLTNLTKDVASTFSGIADGQVLTWDDTAKRWTNRVQVGGSGSGETNTASNLSSDGVGLFAGKVGVNLTFQTLNAGQFDSNGVVVSIRSSAPLTNPVVRGASFPLLTASRLVGIDAAGNITNTATHINQATNLDFTSPAQAQLDSKASTTALSGETNSLWLGIKGPWLTYTDPTSIALDGRKQVITLTATANLNFTATNDGNFAALEVRAVTAQTITWNGVFFPEGAPTNSWSGTNRFYFECVGASRLLRGYYSSGLGGGLVPSMNGSATNLNTYAGVHRWPTNILTATQGRIEAQGPGQGTNYIYGTEEGTFTLINHLNIAHTNQNPLPGELLNYVSMQRWFTHYETNTVFVRKNGSDATGVRGNEDRPFLTITQAVAAAQSGDAVDVGIGIWKETMRISLANNVSLYGQGAGLSRIESDIVLGTAGQGVILNPGDNSVIRGITVRGTNDAQNSFQAAIGVHTPNLRAATNVMVWDSVFYAGTDALYVNTNKAVEMTFNNCYFDAEVDQIYQDGNSSHRLTFNGCTFRGKNFLTLGYLGSPDLPTRRNINNYQGEIIINNSVLIAENATTHQWNVLSGGANAVTRISNSRLVSTSTNSTPQLGTVTNYGGLVVLANCSGFLPSGLKGDGVGVTHVSNMWATVSSAGFGGITVTPRITNGVPTWEIAAGASVSNALYFRTNIVTSLIGTNAGNITNVFCTLDWPKQKYVLTNSITLTNFIGLIDGTAKDARIHLEPQLVNRTITYPVFSAAALGGYWRTNVNSPMYTTLTNGVKYVLSISTEGTNGYMSLTIW